MVDPTVDFNPHKLRARRAAVSPLLAPNREHRIGSVLGVALLLPFLAVMSGEIFHLPVPQVVATLVPWTVVALGGLVFIPAGLKLRRRETSRVSTRLMESLGHAGAEVTYFTNTGYFWSVGLASVGFCPVIVSSALGLYPAGQPLSWPSTITMIWFFAASVPLLGSFLTLRVGVGVSAIVLESTWQRFVIPRERVESVEIGTPVTDVRAPIHFFPFTSFRIILTGGVLAPPPLGFMPDGLKLRMARALDPKHHPGDPLEGTQG